MRISPFITYLAASAMVISCCDNSIRTSGTGAGGSADTNTASGTEASVVNLLLNSSSVRRVTKLEGEGNMSSEDMDRLIKESRLVTKARISSFFPYSNATFPTEHGLVDYNTLCITFAINPRRDVYKGSWPSAGMILEDYDVASTSNGTDNNGYFGFYNIDDEYLIFLQGPTPIESNVIKIRHVTVHEKKNK
jgi:hypothetical protein